MTHKTVGQIVRETREQRGMTIARLSERAGVAKAYLSMIENHRVAPPSPRVLASLEQALGLHEGDLVAAAQWETAPPILKNTIAHQHQAVDQAQQLAHWLLDATSRKAGGGRNLDRLFRTGELRKRVESTLDEITADPGDEQVIALPRRHVANKVPLINKVAAGYPADFTDLGYPARVADEYIGCPDLHDPDAFATRVIGDSMLPEYREGDVVVFSPAAQVIDGCDCFARIEPDHRTTFKRVFFEGTPRRRRVRLMPLNDIYPPQIYDREQVVGLYRAVWTLRKVGT
jgi:repressor LexA